MKSLRHLLFLFVVLLFSSSFTFAQNQKIGLAFSNNTTGLPVIAYPNLFYSQFHPGLDLFYSLGINKNDKNKLFVHANAGAYYHQFVQTLVRIYPSFIYERSLGERFGLDVGLGGGLGLSFEGKNAFELQDNGTYESKAFLGGRTQFLITFELGTSYAMFKEQNSPRLLLKFRSFMQGTYVNSYVPLLPINSFQIGFSYPINK